MDLNGDGLMDLLVSCQAPSGPGFAVAYGELINIKTSFCLRYGNAGLETVCTGFPPCDKSFYRND